MSAKTPNGYPVLDNGSHQLHPWAIPGTGLHITLLAGPVGFILAHIVLWYSEVIESLRGRHDVGGHNKRLMTGSDVDWSEHSGGDAEDLRWNDHPYNTPVLHSFTPKEAKKIRARIKWLNRFAGAEVVIWGGNWPSHLGSTAKTDSMHWEIRRIVAAVQRLARFLATTPRGRRLLKANESQRHSVTGKAA